MTEKEPNDTTSSTLHDQRSDFIRAVGNFFREHPAIAGSLLYLQVTTVGVVYSWALFKRFDINIFDYAETNDFLLAAFKDPKVFGLSIGFTVFNGLFGILTWFMFERVRLRRTTLAVTARRSLYLTWIFVVASIPVSLVLPLAFANVTAESLLNPTNEALTSVQYRATSSSKEQTTRTGLRVIGTTQSFVFFYDRKDTQTLVIPTAQIVEMEHDGPEDEPKENQK